jgi:hypothetical protein
MKIAIDSPLVMQTSRHSITEAGFETILDKLRKSLERNDPHNPGQAVFEYQGLEKPPGLDRPAHRFTRRFPSGETSSFFLDARTMLPSMVVTNDSSGELIERYVYHDVRENPAELASAAAFDPDQRWGESKGLLSRLVRAAGGKNSPNNSQSAAR